MPVWRQSATNDHQFLSQSKHRVIITWLTSGKSSMECNKGTCGALPVPSPHLQRLTTSRHHWARHTYPYRSWMWPSSAVSGTAPTPASPSGAPLRTAWVRLSRASAPPSAATWWQHPSAAARTWRVGLETLTGCSGTDNGDPQGRTHPVQNSFLHCLEASLSGGRQSEGCCLGLTRQ